MGGEPVVWSGAGDVEARVGTAAAGAATRTWPAPTIAWYGAARAMACAWQPGQLLFVGFDGTRLPPDLRELLASGRVGGVVLFRRNVEDPVQLRRLVAEIHRASPEDAPALVAVDQEGGRVQRLRAPWTEWPPMRQVARAEGPSGAAAVGRALAVECREAGIGWDFAPVCDVDTNPANPVIGDRSFGRDPARVGACASAFVEAMQAEQVAACAKHFPGHGDTELDSHRDLPVLRHDRARLDAVELVPFRAAAQAGVATVMTAHVVFEAVDPKRPATFSPEVLGILRHEIGYDGVVVTDDLEMGAVAGRFAPEAMARGALSAGVDVLLACRSPTLRTELLAALERLPDALVEPAIARVVRLKARFAAPVREAFVRGDFTGPPYDAHRHLARRLSDGGGGGPIVDPTEGPERR